MVFSNHRITFDVGLVETKLNVFRILTSTPANLQPELNLTTYVSYILRARKIWNMRHCYEYIARVSTYVAIVRYHRKHHHR